MRPGDLVVTRWGCRFRGRVFPCSIGRGGFAANKREGDGATPLGVHRITGLLYRADRVAGMPGWAQPIGPRDLWSDDPGDSAYNQPVRAPYPCSAERLRRADPLYDMVLLTSWNWPDPQPGRGSAIFLHVWRGPRVPTAGCVALRRDHLRWIIAHISPGARVVVRG
ncbi:L,D-transpeptidase family protein [Alkalilacustris brevis]|uniref:L,D-transpeptidase family protein n=1 Tax=Alkalilacustris brevis TaxID=2026338 RepID=UPI000E0D87FD|nr:L,D-transpeptidase family protein [Alkalilacustris brevis]